MYTLGRLVLDTGVQTERKNGLTSLDLQVTSYLLPLAINFNAKGRMYTLRRLVLNTEVQKEGENSIS